jgi:lipopolysaccharide transport system ATP-binding protein
MHDLAIRAQGVAKRYYIGGERQSYGTLRDAIVRAATTPIARIRHPGSVHSQVETLWALRDVSFEMRAGEVLGIIGRNGAGKSTLLKLLSRITEPTHGRIDLWGRVGSLLEVGTGFHPELTGRENIRLNGAILGMSRAEINRHFDDIVEFAELSKFLDTPVKRYSSGMYVRLAFAVAAHLDPEILVVDEVLAVGDARFQKKCLKKMSEAGRGGRTVLFVSHNMTAVRALCTRAIVLDDGKLVFDGAPIDAVAHYLAGSLVNSAERVWQDAARAPGSREIRLRQVRVCDANGDPSADLDIQRPLSIECEFEVIDDDIKAGLTLQIYNEEGTRLFSSINNHDPKWHGRLMSRGVYKSVCMIPGNLLSDGGHSVSLLMWTEGYRILAREDEVVRFHVHDTGGARGDYMGGMEGALRPLLDWHTERMGQ